MTRAASTTTAGTTESSDARDATEVDGLLARLERLPVGNDSESTRAPGQPVLFVLGPLLLGGHAAHDAKADRVGAIVASLRERPVDQLVDARLDVVFRRELREDLLPRGVAIALPEFVLTPLEGIEVDLLEGVVRVLLRSCHSAYFSYSSGLSRAPRVGGSGIGPTER
jgi:hypothetical protein